MARAGQLRLSPGTHRVDLRAIGFESAAYNVTVPDPYYYKPAYYGPRYYPVAYPHHGWPTVSSPWAQPPLSMPVKVTYIVPQCYAGDVPPKASQLPPGCDIASLRRYY